MIKCPIWFDIFYIEGIDEIDLTFDAEIKNNIRKIRNDCLHYNQDFKAKNSDELKTDALSVLNNLKSILKSILGVSSSLSSKDYLDLIKELSDPKSDDSRNFDETRMKKQLICHEILFLYFMHFMKNSKGKLLLA